MDAQAISEFLCTDMRKHNASWNIENPQTLFFKTFGGFIPKSRSNYNLLGSIAGARRATVLSAAFATRDGTEARNLAVNCTVVAS